MDITGKLSTTTALTRTASLTRTLQRRFPLAVGLLTVAFYGSEQLGERASRYRLTWVALFAIPVVLFAIDPVAAQVDCGSGPLAFLGDLKTLIVEGMGIILFGILTLAGLLKMVSIKGTNRIANAFLGGFFIGVLFYVLGPAVVDIADSSTPVDMSTQCNPGGGGN